jgi:UDP-N-acetylmuramoyl-L-alanyl-D-glutamate--2,6-diaminopimelate ligase
MLGRGSIAMRLSELAADVPGAVVERGPDADITGVVQDSRLAGPGRLFVAVRGGHRDGHDFAPQLAAQGIAVAVEGSGQLPGAGPILRLTDTRSGLAQLAAAFHGRPSRSLRVAGVTGTDGKTTVTHMAAHVLESAGRSAGLMSTVAIGIHGLEMDNTTGLTTADAPKVQDWLAQMRGAGVTDALIEATSHALDQGRVEACDFDVAAVTNVRHDHLDYHGSWEAYVEAKARLIDLCSTGAGKGLVKTVVLNRDDAAYARLAERAIQRRWSYSLETDDADLFAADLSGDAAGSRFRLIAPQGESAVVLRQPARYNVQNALCAAGVCLALGLDVEEVAAGLSSFGGVRGRLERVDLGQPFRVYIDFAHSAGALASTLGELRPLTEGRLIAVFGSTARSDHDRPGMGRAAARGADYFIITTDDPLDQDPAEIAREVESGVEGRARSRDYAVILDRRQAIHEAMRRARPGDVVLLAGKGHERSMRLAGGGAEPWDERAEVEAALRELAR